VIEAAHPVPDLAGLAGARRLVEFIAPLSEDDLVIALISGGGSALLPAPPAGMTLADEIALNEALLRSGAPIAAMNTIRKRLSTVKGGRLAASTRAKVHTLVVSDVPGDDAAIVASGPTLPDASTRLDALRIVERYRLDLPRVAMEHLCRAGADAPSPDDPVFARHTHSLIASASLSLAAAAEAARARGIGAHILSDAIEGEARDAGAWHAAIARQMTGGSPPFARPAVILSGGETTVTLRGTGRGGRNGEFAMALAARIEGLDVVALVADTDGIDGSEQNAGAFVDGSTAARLRQAGAEAQLLLDHNDSFSGFELLNDLFVTGPTGTNVNDFRAMLVQ
jgi:glycerate 2-kinase